MVDRSEREILEKLRGFSTPTVGNVVATFTRAPLCLRLYDPWHGKWYTDQTVRCIFPELGARIGYAVTVVYSLPDPNYRGWAFTDLIDALGEAKKPIILVCQQDLPPDLLPRCGLFGGRMTATFKACGVAGVVTNGPSRDVDEVRELEVQYVMSGISSGHGEFSLKAINVPVSVAGMDVAPGDVVHMDEHGACKFPADKMKELCKNIDSMVGLEDEQINTILGAKSIEEIKAVFEPTKQ
jgi:regulator of RNase E activity RraA